MATCEDCNSGCWDQCSNDCFQGCSGTLKGTCGDTCFGDCSYGCTETCHDGCGRACSFDSCGASCGTACQKGCNNNCTYSCDDGCDNSAFAEEFKWKTKDGEEYTPTTGQSIQITADDWNKIRNMFAEKILPNINKGQYANWYKGATREDAISAYHYNALLWYMGLASGIFKEGEDTKFFGIDVVKQGDPIAASKILKLSDRYEELRKKDYELIDYPSDWITWNT